MNKTSILRNNWRGNFEWKYMRNNRSGLPTLLSGGARSSANFEKKSTFQSGSSDQSDPPGVKAIGLR